MADDPLTYWNEKHNQESAARSNRLERASREYTSASELAFYAGLQLQCLSDFHYQLWGPNDNWLINLYPERNRLHSPIEKRGPFLRLSGEWGLEDVVRAAINAENHNG